MQDSQVVANYVIIYYIILIKCWGYCILLASYQANISLTENHTLYKRWIYQQRLK